VKSKTSPALVAMMALACATPFSHSSVSLVPRDAPPPRGCGRCSADPCRCEQRLDAAQAKRERKAAKRGALGVLQRMAERGDAGSMPVDTAIEVLP
jgi:hypothetical protein